MNTNGNKIIELLGLPEWDENVLKILKELGQDRVEAKDGMGEKLYIEAYDVTLKFELSLRTAEQIEMAEQGNIYFNDVVFGEKSSLLLPFGINIGDNYTACIKKISSQVRILTRWKGPKQDRLVLEIKNKKVIFIMTFTDTDRNLLKNIVVEVFIVEKDFYANWEQYRADV